MRVLGIDYGDSNLGLALSDILLLTAQPLGTYRLKASEKDNRIYFQDLVARYEIGKIVIGNPLRMDGSAGTRTQKTRLFADWLERAVRKPIVFWDERLTTQQALHVLAGQKFRGKKKKDCEDQMAAVIILSTYLESSGENTDVS